MINSDDDVLKREKEKERSTNLDRLRESESVILAEVDTCPIEHLCLFREVRDRERLSFRQQVSILSLDQVIDLVK